MASILPSSVKVTCPNCSRKFEQVLARLNAENNSAACPHCGALFNFKKLIDGLKAFDKDVAAASRNLNKKFGKK